VEITVVGVKSCLILPDVEFRLQTAKSEIKTKVTVSQWVQRVFLCPPDTILVISEATLDTFTAIRLKIIWQRVWWLH